MSRSFSLCTPRIIERTFPLQRFRRGLKRGLLDFDDVSDVVDHQAHGAIFTANHHVHGRGILRTRRRKFELPPQVHRGNDLPSQIDEAGDHRGRKGHASHIQIANDFLNATQFDAEQQVVEIKRAELKRWAMDYFVASA